MVVLEEAVPAVLVVAVVVPGELEELMISEALSARAVDKREMQLLCGMLGILRGFDLPCGRLRYGYHAFSHYELSYLIPSTLETESTDYGSE